MDNQKIVENIQRICRERGTNPTAAGEASGAGKSLVSQLKKRGIMPSIEKFQMLAQYLEVTTSELLGEEKAPTPITGDGPDESASKKLHLIEKIMQMDTESLIELNQVADSVLAQRDE